MLSPADTVIVFVLALVVIFLILFVVMFARSPRSRAQSNPSASTPKGSEIPMEQSAVASRLDPSESTSKGKDPRGVDIGGNYN